MVLTAAKASLASCRKFTGKLHECDSAGDIAHILNESKMALCAALIARRSSPAAEALTLKILNIFLAQRHLRLRSASVLSRPIGLVVDPSNLCRLACPGCVHSERSESLNLFGWRKGTLPDDRFSALLQLCGPHAIGVYFCNYGEPLLNLSTPKLIRRAKAYLLWTGLSTSLSVQRFDADAYVESGLDFMALSIDGATQPAYGRFRRNGHLCLVFENIRKLVNAKRKLRLRTPVLSWNYLAFEHNVHEIPLARRIARRLGVDRFRVVAPFDVSWDDPQIRPRPQRAGLWRLSWLPRLSGAANWNPFPDEVDGAAITRAFDSGWPDHDAPSIAQTAGHTCHWLYKNLVMDATGRILPCCGSPRPAVDLVFATLDGALEHRGDPYNSEKYQRARSWFAGSSGDAAGAPYCARCEWDQRNVNIGGPEIRRYFRAAGSSAFNRESLRLLSEW